MNIVGIARFLMIIHIFVGGRRPYITSDQRVSDRAANAILCTCHWSRDTVE